MRPDGPPPWSDWFKLLAGAWFALWLAVVLAGLALDYFGVG